MLKFITVHFLRKVFLKNYCLKWNLFLICKNWLKISLSLSKKEPHLLMFLWSVFLQKSVIIWETPLSI